MPKKKNFHKTQRLQHPRSSACYKFSNKKNKTQKVKNFQPATPPSRPFIRRATKTRVIPSKNRSNFPHKQRCATPIARRQFHTRTQTLSAPFHTPLAHRSVRDNEQNRTAPPARTHARTVQPFNAVRPRAPLGFLFPDAAPPAGLRRCIARRTQQTKNQTADS